MKAQRKSKQVMISTICLGAVTLWSGLAHSQMPTDIKSYAQACMNELTENGSKPITFPPVLQCADGPILPITQDSVAIPAQTSADGSMFTDTTKCDRPPLLDISSGGIGQCVPNSRLRVTQVPQTSVEAKDKPYYALLCRNYQYRSLDSQALNPEYDDVAMIVYSPLNHKTCFFQRLANTQIRDLPQEKSAFAAIEALPGKDIPSPFSSNADTFWDNPDVVKRINCARCHDANPFVRSPYAFQVTKDANKLPNRTFGEAYAIFHLDQFGAEWKKYHAYFKIEDHSYGTPGACLNCHNLGPGFSSGDFTEYSAGKLAPGQLDSTTFTLTHWMPPGANKDTWETRFRASVKAMLACNADPAKDNCKRVDLH
ncbi:hypothetical protein [Bradyrhizobium lablabi]|uniref:hypothetical protein n=1 Tax=Bradyrhizobium lablabi TaxID=722472 RepID=UPI001BADF872|nr:hypothetical protein [Bradyrhizobium lablabi]MBR0695074.1 hypothetical protein [Bradyrhizobium lablabi]